MRRWSLLSVVSMLAFSGACKDEAADPFVDEAINWLLSCDDAKKPCFFQVHQTNDTVEMKVKDCSRDGTGMSFTIEASKDEARKIPSSTLFVSLLDPTKNTCRVIVSDSQGYEDLPLLVEDTCAGNADGSRGCVVTGDFDSDGWAFSGTITCTSLADSTQPSLKYKLTSGDRKSGVPIRIDNCD